MTRRKAREQALSIIFEQMFKDESIKEILSLAEDSRDLKPDAFALELVNGTMAHVESIDKEIEKYLIGWSKNRISKVVISILRLAIYEIGYLDEIPVSVTINEAVELAKKYGGDGDSAFVNGLLGTYSRGTGEKGGDSAQVK